MDANKIQDRQLRKYIIEVVYPFMVEMTKTGDVNDKGGPDPNRPPKPPELLSADNTGD